MKAITIRARSIIPAGSVYVMPNTEHPEISLWTTLDEAEHLIVACHIDDEQRVRDAVALAQEYPKWWLDLRRFERVLQTAAAPTPDKESPDA